MTTQTIPFVPNQPSLTDHQPQRLAPAISTALLSDSLLLRSGLQHILRDTPFAIVGAASATGPMRLHYCALNTALVIIEATQNIGRALAVVRQVRERSPETRIVALADQFDLGFVRLGHEAGVNGFCLAGSAPDVLVRSLELIMLGESVLPFGVLRSIMDEAVQSRERPLQDNLTSEPNLSELEACKLSVREREILGCLTKGEPNKLIARKLAITEATIKVHVKAILRKIGASNRTQAAMWASQRLPRRGVPTPNV